MKKKGKKNSPGGKVKEINRQRREYVHRQRRKKKRKKRQREREQAAKRRARKQRLRERQLEESRKKAELQEEFPIEDAEIEQHKEKSVKKEAELQKHKSQEQGKTEKNRKKEKPEKSLEKRKKSREKREKTGREERRQPAKGNRKKRPKGRYRRRRRRRRKRTVQAAVLCVFMAVLYFFSSRKVVKELMAEAGDPVPELSAFLLAEEKDAHFTEKIDRLNMNTTADYEIGITIAGKEYTSILHVADTKKPVVEVKKVQACKDCALEPERFIEKIDDATKTAIEFVKEPDFSKEGTQEVKLKVTDEGGNAVSVSTKLKIVEDTEPPVIEGVKELTVAIGEGISYKKGVTVSDNLDKDVELKVDNRQVRLNKKGDYPLVYIAEDMAGNVTEEKTVVHVKPASVETATEEMVNKKADEILEQITTESMSRRDKAKAIFDWVHGNVGWSDGTPKTNWIQGAYRGLYDRRGDCYVYASTSKCLLTRAGIENMDIGFSNARRTHYWNLIDLGEGWYHFDTTRRADGRSFFYYKDADIRAYSSSHNGSHAYDPSQYPVIQ